MTNHVFISSPQFKYMIFYVYICKNVFCFCAFISSTSSYDLLSSSSFSSPHFVYLSLKFSLVHGICWSQGRLKVLEQILAFLPLFFTGKPRACALHYEVLVYTTQVNSAFHTRWLASSEVISQALSPPRSRRKQNGFPFQIMYS